MGTLRAKIGILLIVWMILLTSGLIICAAQPSYQGKAPLYWLDSLSTNMEGGIEAFKAMGSNAVPFLIEILEYKPSSFTKFIQRELLRYDLKHPGSKVIGALSRSLPSAHVIEDRRKNALFLIGKIGPEAEAAISLLFRLLVSTNENWRIETEVGPSIAAMGEKAIVLVPDYLRWLKSDDADARELAAGLLISVGPKAKVAIPALLDAAQSKNLRVTTAAARALWAIDRQTNVAVRVLRQGLDSTNSTRRQLALCYLREMGPGAETAGPVIKGLLRDTDDLVRREAERALTVIDPHLLHAAQVELSTNTAGNVEGLIRDIREGSIGEQIRAQEVLPVFGPDAAPAVPVLIEVLGNPIPVQAGVLGNTAQMNFRRNAAEALSEIGEAARAAAPALLARLCAPFDGTTRSIARLSGELAWPINLFLKCWRIR